MNFTHGGLPESEAQSWTPENQRKLGRIVADLEKKETAYKAWGAYHELKRYFMVETWTKFVCDLTDFRKQNGFRGINEMLAEANPHLIPKECVMKEGMQSEALTRIAAALKQLSEGITSLLGPGEESAAPAKGKAAKVEDKKPPEPTIDFVALRAECKVLIVGDPKNPTADGLIKTKGRDKVVEIFNKFKAFKRVKDTDKEAKQTNDPAMTLPEIKDADLPALRAALDAEKAIEPEAVA